MATQTKTASKAAKTPAKKAPARKPEAKAPEPEAELTPVDDGVSIEIEGQRAKVKIQGTFDLDGLMAVTKRVARARAELS